MTAHLIEFAALALAVSGVVAVLIEILTKQPRALGEIAADIETFAAPAPRPMRFTPVVTRAAVEAAPANANLGRQAA